MLNKRIINTGGAGAACTTDTTQILDAGTTDSVALYRFEDNANDTALSTGKFSKGAVFNGSNAYIDLGNTIATSTRAVSMWVNTDDFSERWPFQQGDGQSTENYIRFYNTDDIQVRWGNVTQTFSGYSANTWYHIVAQKDENNNANVWINGVEMGSTGSPSSITVNKTNIGRRYNNGAYQYYFKGKIDQVRIFNKALSSSEISTLYNETTSTVSTLQVLGDYSCIAAYTFEGNANDLSTNYNGTASNIIYDYSGTASNVTYTTGKFGKAIEFNGSTGFVNVENMSTVLANDFTVSMWVKTPSSLPTSGYPTFISLYGYLGSGSAYGWSVEIWGAGAASRFMFYWVSASHQGNSLQSGPISADTWYHVLAKKNSSSASLYINGQLDHSGGTSISSYGMYYSSITDLTFGAKRLTDGGSISSQFTGLVDQVRLFTKQLNAGEISNLYNETATSAASTTIENPSTVAYYKMADATDETGSYNGTASNVDFNVQGKYGFAGKFNGSNSYFNTNYNIPSNTSEYSLSMWIYMPSTSAYGRFLAGALQSSGAANGFYVSINTNGTGRFYLRPSSGTTSQLSGNIVMAPEQWHHFVVTSSSSTNALYINGQADGTVSRNTVNFGSPITLGRAGAYSVDYFPGNIDQVRIFNKAISAAEVTTLYNEVQCANTITTPEDYFQTKLYSGNSGTQALTGVGFAPDLTWIKGRTNWSHSLQDTLRGPGTSTSIYPDLNSSQGTYGAYGQISSFDTDGFTVAGGGHGTYGYAQVNMSGYTYVAWNWKAASSNTTNNDGTTASTIRASQESGFSIVKFPATNASINVGHGLGVEPAMIIWKNLDTADNWYVYHKDLSSPNTQWLNLNLDSAVTTNSTYNFSSVTSTTFTTHLFAGSGTNNIVSYCFANIDGYQRISSYVGNGSANGPFVYTGFEPAWLMIKNIDNTGAWIMHDNKRVTENPRNRHLRANTAGQEDTGSGEYVNFFSNGFQLAGASSHTNTNNEKYLFIAIAANPDTTAPTKANSFKTKIYTGTGSTHAITGLGFKPDFIWTKNRDTTDSSALVDSVSGIISPAPYLASNSTAAQATSSNMPTSVQADGYTITGAGGRTNTSGEDYVSWNWKAGDHDRNLAAINNDGGNTTVVSVNKAAGFGIVTGRIAASGFAVTSGHGFEVKPELIIYKPITMTAHFYAYSEYGGSLLGTNNVLKFSGSDAASSDSLFDITDKTFVAGATASAHNFIAYCFRSTSGYSKIGTYTISSSSDRVITGLGFTPSWVMVRRTDSSGSWVITDASRLITKEIYADLNNAENTDSNGVQSFDADGFTVGTGSWLGASGGTYLYMAFK